MNRSRFVALGDVGDGAAGNVLFYPSICLLHDVLHTGTDTLAGNGVMVQGGQGDDAPALLSLGGGGGGRGLMLGHKGHSRRPRMNRLKDSSAPFASFSALFAAAEGRYLTRCILLARPFSLGNLVYFPS